MALVIADFKLIKINRKGYIRYFYCTGTLPSISAPYIHKIVVSNTYNIFAIWRPITNQYLRVLTLKTLEKNFICMAT